MFAMLIGLGPDGDSVEAKAQTYHGVLSFIVVGPNSFRLRRSVSIRLTLPQRGRTLRDGAGLGLSAFAETGTPPPALLAINDLRSAVNAFVGGLFDPSNSASQSR